MIVFSQIGFLSTHSVVLWRLRKGANFVSEILPYATMYHVNVRNIIRLRVRYSILLGDHAEGMRPCENILVGTLRIRF